MDTVCPRCKSKNVKCIETKIYDIKCLCLNCNKEFDRQPTKKEIQEFNS